MPEAVAHLVFDCESIADGELIAKVRYPGQGLSACEAIKTYQDELMEQKGTTFIPYTFQMPISVVVAKVAKDFQLIDLVSLDEPKFRSHVITAHFWKGWEVYKRPQWVTFNGRTFDLPLMEMAAFRYGISLGQWFKSDGYRSPRNRFSVDAHMDLQDLLTNFSATRFNGGLNLAAQILGKPGKITLTGDQVQEQYDAGDLQAISDYCRCDVLDTYFVFLRSMVLTGKMSLERELELVAQSKAWIEQRADLCAAYATYLERWNQWDDPWENEDLT
ncbi:3'-5' exonuclease [Stieleria varia]|uniref:Putative 3'-5' exonuclease related to the exonuclease domain of PolB n=1 Tax=Stieleria varia TaxID=2528005 RepID=A0A5C6B475_9BACT|nr:3'-5' exonuclease [Stieleria varia]TWU06119.1 putative 3'-5' exonuclease related to the exonuclease domain of PolB [Stieleria varia]